MVRPYGVQHRAIQAAEPIGGRHQHRVRHTALMRLAQRGAAAAQPHALTAARPPLQPTKDTLSSCTHILSIETLRICRTLTLVQLKRTCRLSTFLDATSIRTPLLVTRGCCSSASSGRKRA